MEKQSVWVWLSPSRFIFWHNCPTEIQNKRKIKSHVSNGVKWKIKITNERLTEQRALLFLMLLRELILYRIGESERTWGVDVTAWSKLEMIRKK